MHHDAVASSYGRKTGRPRHVAFAFGHNWVILAVWVPLPWNPTRGVAIPILFRLYRSKKLCPASDYKKRTTLALELFKVLLEWNVELGRRLTLITDSEYACRTIVKHLPAAVTFIGPVVMNAALFDFPSPQQKPGRGAPRKRGDRLPTPAQLITDPSYPWIETTVTLYGRSVAVLVKTVTCLWYQVAGLRPVRLVITRDPKGHFEDRVFFCTDKDLPIVDVLRLFCCRWTLEIEQTSCTPCHTFTIFLVVVRVSYQDDRHPTTSSFFFAVYGDDRSHQDLPRQSIGPVCLLAA